MTIAPVLWQYDTENIGRPDISSPILYTWSPALLLYYCRYLLLLFQLWTKKYLPLLRHHLRHSVVVVALEKSPLYSIYIDDTPIYATQFMDLLSASLHWIPIILSNHLEVHRSPFTSFFTKLMVCKEFYGCFSFFFLCFFKEKLNKKSSI